MFLKQSHGKKKGQAPDRKKCPIVGTNPSRDKVYRDDYSITSQKALGLRTIENSETQKRDAIVITSADCRIQAGNRIHAAFHRPTAGLSTDQTEVDFSLRLGHSLNPR
jgi:hypothetical protein